MARQTGLISNSNADHCSNSNYHVVLLKSQPLQIKLSSFDRSCSCWLTDPMPQMPVAINTSSYGHQKAEVAEGAKHSPGPDSDSAHLYLTQGQMASPLPSGKTTSHTSASGTTSAGLARASASLPQSQPGSKSKSLSKVSPSPLKSLKLYGKFMKMDQAFRGLPVRSAFKKHLLSRREQVHGWWH